MPHRCSVIHLLYLLIPYLHHSLITLIIVVPHATVTNIPFVPLHSSLLGVNFHLPHGKFFLGCTHTMLAPETRCRGLKLKV